MGVGHQDDLHAGDPALNIVLATAGIVLGHPLVGPGVIVSGVGLDRLAVHQTAVLVAQEVEEDGAGVLQADGDLVGSGDFDLLDSFDADYAEQPGGARLDAKGPLELVVEVLGGQLVAGHGEDDPLAQVDHHRQAIIGDLPRLGQRGFKLGSRRAGVPLAGVVGLVVNQRIVEVLQGLVGPGRGAKGRVDGLDVAGDGNDQRMVTVHGLGRNQHFLLDDHLFLYFDLYHLGDDDFHFFLYLDHLFYGDHFLDHLWLCRGTRCDCNREKQRADH